MPKINAKKLLFTGTTLLSFALLAACGGDATEGAGESASGGNEQLVVGISGAPISLDLHAANDANSNLINAQIFETLVMKDNNQNIVPGLATEWELIDERTYEFTLRQGVTFHNGENFTAEDVKYSFTRAAASPSVAAIVGEIDPDQLYIVDDYTIRVGTFEPFAPLLLHLAHPAASVKSSVAIEASGDQVGREPVGTGPFEFVSWNADDSVQLRAFEDFHGEAAHIENVLFRAITETTQRTIELETGELSIALGIAANDRDRIANHDNLELLTTESFQINYLGFNLEIAPFDNKLVRQAINYAVDVELIHATILEGIGTIVEGPVGPNIWGFYDGIEGYEFNLERARELMAEAGFADGFETTITTNDNPERVQLVTIIANMLEEIGIDATIQQMDWAAYLEGMNSGEFGMFMFGWVAVTGDADYALFPLFHSDFHGGAGNRSFFADDHVDYLLETGRSTRDEEVRLETYRELQEILVEQAPWVFLNIPETTAGIQSNIGGLTINPTGHHHLASVYFE